MTRVVAETRFWQGLAAGVLIGALAMLILIWSWPGTPRATRAAHVPASEPGVGTPLVPYATRRLVEPTPAPAVFAGESTGSPSLSNLSRHCLGAEPTQ